MKSLLTTASCVMLLLCSFFSQAQDKPIPINEPDYNKPKLFSDLPSRMNLNVSNLETLFRFSAGETVSVQVTPDLLLQGIVASTSDASSPGFKSVVIRSTNRQGAIFTFTRRTGKEGASIYIGRLMSKANGDAYEIAHENGSYFLQKKNLYDLISE